MCAKDRERGHTRTESADRQSDRSEQLGSYSPPLPAVVLFSGCHWLGSALIRPPFSPLTLSQS